MLFNSAGKAHTHTQTHTPTHTHTCMQPSQWLVLLSNSRNGVRKKIILKENQEKSPVIYGRVEMPACTNCWSRMAWKRQPNGHARLNWRNGRLPLAGNSNKKRWDFAVSDKVLEGGIFFIWRFSGSIPCAVAVRGRHHGTLTGPCRYLPCVCTYIHTYSMSLRMYVDVASVGVRAAAKRTGCGPVPMRGAIITFSLS